MRIGETFTIRIDNIITVWCGSIEVGLAACDPLAACQFPSASSIELSSWVLSGEHLYVDSQRQTHSLISDQSSLDDLKEGDTLGQCFCEGLSRMGYSAQKPLIFCTCTSECSHPNILKKTYPKLQKLS